MRAASCLLAAAAALLLTASSACAEILLDLEPDPIPLVKIVVAIPAGFESSTPGEAAAPMLMRDVLDAGTRSLDREAYLDRLASFGASTSFQPSNIYSVWSLTFPLVAGKDYGALAELLAENWSAPRLTDQTFAIAMRKLRAALEAGLDSDMSLGMTTTRRWIDRRHFGDYPVTLDSLDSVRRETVAAVWTRNFLGVKEVWAGVVAPESSLPVVRTILSRVFAAQGAITEKNATRPLHLRDTEPSASGGGPVFLILDKPGRTQTMTSVMAVSRSHYSASEELASEFGRHVLVDSDLGSIFGQEIRTKRGLAYMVSGPPPYFLGHPTIGLATNPVRPKTPEALEVISKLLATGYEQPSLLEKLPEEQWTQQWQSFVYGRLLDRSTPDGRLDERMDVAVGELDPKLYARPITEWKTDRGEVTKTLAQTWKNAIVVGAVVGDAKELEPMLRKDFPQYRIVVIPYRASILSKTYE